MFIAFAVACPATKPDRADIKETKILIDAKKSKMN